MKETLKMALETLEYAGPSWIDARQPAITAIKEALAQPEQEPVAWMFQHNETGRMSYVSNDGLHNPTTFIEMNPRYALVCPLFTTPPQRKPLSDEEIGAILEDINAFGTRLYTFARAIEAAHGIKE